MGGRVRQSVVGGGHRHGPPLGVPGWGEGVRRKLNLKKKLKKGTKKSQNTKIQEKKAFN